MAKLDLSSEHFKRDPFPTLTRLVEDGPLAKMKVPLLGRVTFLTRHEAISTFLKDQDRFAVDARNAGKKTQFGLPWMPKSIHLVAQNMLSQDEPTHRRLRKLVDQPFRNAAIAELNPAIERIAHQLLDEMEAAGETNLVDGFCRPLPLAVICELLGLPTEDRAEFMSWMDGLQGASTLHTVFAFMPILRKMNRYLEAEIARRRDDPAPGLITELIHAEADGERLSKDEMIAMIFLLFFAGHETTTHLLSNSVIALAAHPETLARLKADWSLAPTATEELHRFTCPVQMTKPRFAREDMELFGCPLKQGERVMALLAAGNLDPTVYDNPTRLDIDRPKLRQLGFGGGPHICLGLHLARAELRVGLEVLYTRWPDLTPAKTSDELKWIKRIGTRGVTVLPIRFRR